jgi:hypothetical protein
MSSAVFPEITLPAKITLPAFVPSRFCFFPEIDGLLELKKIMIGQNYGLSKLPATDARFPTSCPIETPLSNPLLNLAAACSPVAPKFAPIADDSP